MEAALFNGVISLVALGAMLACAPSDAIPSVPAAPVRLWDASAQIGIGASACTHQTPASADGHRWCSFTVGATSGRLADLWVMDVTAAAGGHVPRCDGTSTDCLELTSTLGRAGAFFEGDTLIYYTDPVSPPTEEFLGRIFAWRPGWSHGRQISSDRGFTCIGQRRSSAAACFDDPAGDPANRDSAEVRVGYLDNQDGPQLPVIGRWPLRNGNDTDWQADFSPDGTTFGLSSAAAIGQKESLWILATEDAGKGATAATIDDVVYWQVSNDGAAIYFLRGLPQQADLYIADFPSGGGVSLIEAGILSFTLIGDRPADQALGFVKDLGATMGEFRLLANRSQPAPKSIFTYNDILDGARVSRDLRYTAWMDFSFRGVVIQNDDLASCAIDIGNESPVFDLAFLEHAGMMFWNELRPEDTSRRDSFYAPPDRCRTKAPFAKDIDFFLPIGDKGLVFADGLDTSTGGSSLKYIAASADGASLDPRGPVRVQDGVVGASVVFVGVDPLFLLYSVTGPSVDLTGTFVFGPVPL